MEVNMMGLAVLRMWLLRMKWGYRGYNNVLVTREEVNMMGLVVLRVWLVMNRGYRYLAYRMGLSSSTRNQFGRWFYSKTVGWWSWTVGSRV